MSHTLVKITHIPSHDDYGTIEKKDQKWCLATRNSAGDPINLCEGLIYEEYGAKYQIKEVQRGGITCQECLRKIKEYKAIML